MKHTVICSALLMTLALAGCTQPTYTISNPEATFSSELSICTLDKNTVQNLEAYYLDYGSGFYYGEGSEKLPDALMFIDFDGVLRARGIDYKGEASIKKMADQTRQMASTFGECLSSDTTTWLNDLAQFLDTKSK
jgi:hypothetical protein